METTTSSAGNGTQTRKARSLVPPDENKRQRFVRLADTRVTRTIQLIRMIGQMGGQSRYEYGGADVEKIRSALNYEIGLMVTKLKPDKTHQLPLFSVEGSGEVD